MNKTLAEMTGPELVAEYNRCAVILGEVEVKRFADRKVGTARVEGIRARMPEQQELVVERTRRSYPEDYSRWHAVHHKAEGRGKRDAIEMVFQRLLENREGALNTDEVTGAIWQDVYLDNAKINGMTAKIWAGHLCQLSKEGRYKKIKSNKGAFGAILVG